MTQAYAAIIVKILIFLVAILFICWFIMGFHLFRLNRYLKKHHYTRWRELTIYGQKGFSDPLRGMRFILRNTPEKDEKLLRLKDSARLSTIYAFISVATLILTVGSLIIYLVFFMSN